MEKLEKLTEKLFSSSQFCGVWEKYISTIERYLHSGFDISPQDRARLQEYIDEAYERIKRG